MGPKEVVTKGKQPSLFFHRKLAKSGGSRYLAIGKILPLNWQFVRVRVAKVEGDTYWLQIDKLA